MGLQLRGVAIGESELTLGRDQACDIVLDDSEASRQHAAVRPIAGGRAELRDLGSRNGTFVDGRRIEGPVELSGGETIRIGETDIAVESTGAGETVVAGAPFRPSRRRPPRRSHHPLLLPRRPPHSPRRHRRLHPLHRRADAGGSGP